MQIDINEAMRGLEYISRNLLENVFAHTAICLNIGSSNRLINFAE